MDALIIESMTSTSEVQESKTYDVQAYSRPLLPDADLYTDSLVVRLCGGGERSFHAARIPKAPNAGCIKAYEFVLGLGSGAFCKVEMHSSFESERWFRALGLGLVP